MLSGKHKTPKKILISTQISKRELEGFNKHNLEGNFIGPYRICYIQPELKARFSDIKNLLLYIKNNFLNDEEDEMSSLLKQVLDQTSVTSVATTDQPEKAE